MKAKQTLTLLLVLALMGSLLSGCGGTAAPTPATQAQVMFSFFEEYDFSGKTIIPFCTHFGSRDGGTFKTIAELEPNAEVLGGIAVNQRDVAGCEKDVLDWLEGLGY